MEFSVSINQSTRETYFDPIFKEQPDLEEKLLRDFSSYKQQSINPQYFGRDAPLIKPQLAYNIGLMHIHLALSPNQFDQKINQHFNTSDVFLLYVQGSYNYKNYSLLAIFSPNAHEQARDEKLMNHLCWIAKEFYDKN